MPRSFYRLSNLLQTSIRRTKHTMSEQQQRKLELIQNITDVKAAMATVPHHQKARLVAVSKYKPAEDLMHVYETGHRHFGENYVQELVEKSTKLPSDIQWHFIGHLQSNKCKTVAAIPNLFAVETVDSIKKADTLNKACISCERKEPLRVFVQVNTSREEAKSGVDPESCTQVCQHIQANCPQLTLQGLMTIGMFGRDPSETNPDFECLVDCKKKTESMMPGTDLELSMGMSGDYLQALKAGSTNIRVGTTIFGARPKK
ncbi:YggS family pyridoxal phosphate enzyme [Halteromyces radiatus]|uniref:YggS family pyridoxal phosphate enzyme n=1 Tax=Halteromyces radiatus TaxID=101107 RepID=UPI00221E9FF3|nr:YggS family pyridoxal phosphate enzyme [Halteromyces radiatus]KAI8086010.1 YggS family pyridoxal phosphate enzyme [Halteromyces radiatus]